MKKSSLIVAETFYSIQGEGATMGIPAVFLRLAGCNLLCQSASWRCDTIEVWQKGTLKHFEEVLTLEQITRLKEGAHLVITGGEPLKQQKNIVEYLDWLITEQHVAPTVEVETNGTILPDRALMMRVHYWNVSPKLANSGEPFIKRYNEIALAYIQEYGESCIFKFVIKEPEDVLEMLNDFDIINPDNIVLMPAGSTQEELLQTRPLVVEQCINMGFRYSERLHIVIWNKKTGV